MEEERCEKLIVKMKSIHLKSLSSLLEMVPLPPPGGPKIMVFVAMLRREEEAN